MADAIPVAARGVEATAEPVREGDVVARRFRIGRCLGVGGMGIVFLARDLEYGGDVALKFLSRDVGSSSFERFMREARAASVLRNPHVTRVLDVGELDSGVPFIVMEYLAGTTLAEMAASGANMAGADVARWALQACEGLAEAHARGIVHRDLKPANLFLTTGPDGAPLLKVLDFGISKFLAEAEDGGLTSTGNILGSPSFVAPEQLINPQGVGPRADVWGLGVTMYYLLAKQLPFDGESRVQICMLVLNSTPAPLHELRPDLPRELCDAIMLCLEKDPESRHADVGELAARLAPFAAAEAHEAASRIARLLGEGEATKVLALTETPPRSAAVLSVVAASAQAAPPPPPPSHEPANAGATGRTRTTTIALASGLALVLVLTVAVALRSSASTPIAHTAAPPPSEAASAELPAAATTSPPAQVDSVTVASPSPPAGTASAPSQRPRRAPAPRDGKRDPHSYR
jgi:serine/threonine-protein kinase